MSKNPQCKSNDDGDEEEADDDDDDDGDDETLAKGLLREETHQAYGEEFP